MGRGVRGRWIGRPSGRAGGREGGMPARGRPTHTPPPLRGGATAHGGTRKQPPPLAPWRRSDTRYQVPLVARTRAQCDLRFLLLFYLLRIVGPRCFPPVSPVPPVPPLYIPFTNILKSYRCHSMLNHDVRA
jgi:hypothetical protein